MTSMQSHNTPKILIIATSHAQLGTTQKPTGLWAEELAAPFYLFTKSGLHVDIVSILGGEVPFDPRSIDMTDEQPESVQRLLKDTDLLNRLETTKSVDEINFSQYDAAFLPGGHGTMWDFPFSLTLSKGLSHMAQNGKIIAAVCHGPSGLIEIKLQNGDPFVKGKKVNAFTNAEEEAVGLTTIVPFLLESRLNELGAEFESGPKFEPFAVRDGNLITGQNPMSSELVAKHVVEALEKVAV